MHVCVNKQEYSVPLGLAPTQMLSYIARRSRWYLRTISNFRLHVMFRAALDSSQCSVGASWHMPSGRNTEAACFGPVLWLRWWWWGKYCVIPRCPPPPRFQLQMTFCLRTENWRSANSNMALNQVFWAVLWRSVQALRRIFDSRTVVWCYIPI